MKIGLVSYHVEPNYGTMLQAYALAATIQSEGEQCEYINYTPVRLPMWRRFAAKIAYSLGYGLNKGEFGFFRTKAFKSTMQAFERFHKTYILTSKQIYYWNTLSRACDNYKYFIVGSDQTWSPYMNKNSMTINFLPFVKEEFQKRSYAPSIGTIDIDKAFQSRLINELSSFSHLSCRERQNCEKLATMLGKKVNYVVDPTLLLTPADWNKIAIKPRITEESYVLAYILGEKKCISDYAEALAKEKKLPIYYIVTRPCYIKERNALTGVGPDEFIGLIRNAAYVVTDSFHGSIFSINYGVNFYSFAKREIAKGIFTNDNDRIWAFLGELGLENRFKADDNQNFEDDIDYAQVHSILNELRAQSKEYLKQILNK